MELVQLGTIGLIEDIFQTQRQPFQLVTHRFQRFRIEGCALVLQSGNSVCELLP
ncbi:hypothetical protein [Nocardia sp. NPDC056000]|uniref:hypothetical protein n=1 Tax=Nocardia sp. NPDC056000 TaxID=3345674 RepID=UPI0035E05620